MNEIRALFDALVGPDTSAHDLTLLQIGVRAVLVYLAGLLMLRMGGHRFLGKNSAFDIVLGFIFGTTLSRAINGTAPFVGTLGAGLVLLSLHWLFSTAAFHSDRLNVLFNGRAIPVVEDGRTCRDNMRRERVNERLLEEALRTRGRITDVEAVAHAYYERNGEISVIPRDRGARVLEVHIEEGVQTVRIQLE